MSIQAKKYTSKKTGKTTTKYYACVYDPISETTIWGPGRDKRKEAVTDEAEAIKDLNKGKSKTTGDMLFKDAAELWVSSTEKTYAESTWKGYKSYINAQLLPIFGDVSVKKITAIHIQKYKNEISTRLNAATVNKSIGILSMIMDFCIKPLRLINDNPCDGIKRNKVTVPTHDTWDEQTIGYFLNLDEVINSDYYEMFILSFTTALRPGEVCGIPIDALKGNNLLSLYRGYNKYGNITDMKTSVSHRPLTLDSIVYQLLEHKVEKKKIQEKEYNRKIKEAIMMGGPFSLADYNQNDFLFTYENGNPISPNSYSRAFRNIIKSHNRSMQEIESEKGELPKGYYYLPPIRLYDGRHSFATNTILNGENPKIISEVMGSSVSTIMKRYVHLGSTSHQKTLTKYSSKILDFNIEKKKRESHG